MMHIVLYSGGPDSFITYHYVKSKYPTSIVTPIYFDLGHRYAKEEMSVVQNTLPGTLHAGVLRGLKNWEESDAFIWHRNAFLVLAATKYLRGKQGMIWLSVQKDEMNIPDRSEEFFNKMGSLLEVLSQGQERWFVDTPWRTHDKTDMVAWYKYQRLSEIALCQTWSCYQPINSRHCGDCPACIRRYIAFAINDIDQSDSFEISPTRSETAKQYRKKARNKDYGAERSARIIQALGA